MNEWAYEWMNGPRRLGPFSSCCSIWLAESAVLSPSRVRPPQPWQTGRGDVWTERHTATDGAAVRSFKAIRPCGLAQVTSLRVVIRLLPPRCWLDAATKATTSWWQLTIMYARRSFWQIYWPPVCADKGCVLYIYIGLQIFTLWQKSKVGVRIIFQVLR